MGEIRDLIVGNSYFHLCGKKGETVILATDFPRLLVTLLSNSNQCVQVASGIQTWMYNHGQAT